MLPRIVNFNNLNL